MGYSTRLYGEFGHRTEPAERYFKRYIYDPVDKQQQKAYLQRIAVGHFTSFTEPLASYKEEGTPINP